MSPWGQGIEDYGFEMTFAHWVVKEWPCTGPCNGLVNLRRSRVAYVTETLRCEQESFQIWLIEVVWSPLNVDSTISWAEVSGWIKGEKWVENHPLLLSASSCGHTVTSCLKLLLPWLPYCYRLCSQTLRQNRSQSYLKCFHEVFHHHKRWVTNLCNK